MDNELKTNAVHLSQDEQYQIRKNIVRLHKQGKIPKEIVIILDVSRRHVDSTIKTFKEEGINGIKPKKRGRRHGDKHSLTPNRRRRFVQLSLIRIPNNSG